jgi:hypothetical protein
MMRVSRMVENLTGQDLSKESARGLNEKLVHVLLISDENCRVPHEYSNIGDPIWRRDVFPPLLAGGGLA